MPGGVFKKMVVCFMLFLMDRSRFIAPALPLFWRVIK